MAIGVVCKFGGLNGETIGGKKRPPRIKDPSILGEKGWTLLLLPLALASSSMEATQTA